MSNENNQPQFRDPFLITNYDKENVGRIQCDIPKNDYNFLRSILPGRGDAIWQNTFSIITHKLITSLKQNGITTFTDGDRYKQFILGIDLSSGTIDRSLRVTDAPNDGRTVEIEGSRDTNITNSHADIPSKSIGKGGKGKGRKGKIGT